MTHRTTQSNTSERNLFNIGPDMLHHRFYETDDVTPSKDWDKRFF